MRTIFWASCPHWPEFVAFSLVSDGCHASRVEPCLSSLLSPCCFCCCQSAIDHFTVFEFTCPAHPQIRHFLVSPSEYRTSGVLLYHRGRKPLATSCYETQRIEHSLWFEHAQSRVFFFFHSMALS